MNMLRMTAAALLAVLLAPAAVQAQDAEDPAAEPSWIAPLAPQSLLLDLARAGPRVFAVGERGHVLYSTDDGASWTQVVVPTSANLTAVYFVDDLHGWAVGHDEVILRTVDGGDTWTRVHFEPENNRPLLDVWFADAARGMAVGAYGVMYASSDGGESWAPVEFAPTPLAAPAAPDPDDYEADLDFGFDFHLNAIAGAPDGALYVAAEAGRLYRSDDQGASWRELPSSYDGSYYGILPLGGESLLIMGLRGHLFRSDDGGASWQQLETGTVALLNSATRVSEQRIIVAGNNGVLLVSDDGGQSVRFTQQDDRKSLSAVLAAGGDEVIVAGEAGVKRLAIPESR